MKRRRRSHAMLGIKTKVAKRVVGKVKKHIKTVAKSQPKKSLRHSKAGKGNQGKTYNVVQGDDCKIVQHDIAAATLRNINTRIATASAEPEDQSPEARLKLNTPSWAETGYQPHSEPDIFVEAFNNPTDDDIMDIE